MVFYDFDYAMWNTTKDYFNFFVQPEGMSAFKVSTAMMRSLIRNEEFKETFLERLKYQLENVWNADRVLERIDEIYNTLKPEMGRNQTRWGMTIGHWNEQVEYLREYTRLRARYVKNTAKSFFNLSEAEMKEYFGG